MKYKTEIHNGFSSVYVSILDENDNWVCHLNFNKQHIESLGNRYDVDNNNFIRFATSDLEASMFSVLYKAQEAIRLTEYKINLDTSS